MKGRLILIVGVPGGGKSTLLAYARETFPELVFPTSWTTRPMRPGEVEGQTYHFASEDEFTDAAKEGKFLEWVTIDTGNRYGTLKVDITEALAAGKCVIREVEIMGARRIRELLGSGVKIIFITSGSWEAMSKRMLLRAPMGEEELEKRRERYEREALFESEADWVVTNLDGGLEEAKKQFHTILESILHR